MGEIEEAIAAGELRTGQRLPSIRQGAERWGVSRNSVVEVYDRLVAAGLLESVPGSGFYVSRPERTIRHVEPLPRESSEIDAVAMLRSGMTRDWMRPRPGWGGLPTDWMDEAAIRKAVRELASDRGRTNLVEYGHPAGLPGLRMQLHRELARLDIHAEPGQIVTTMGASQALDLVCRVLLRPGDTVLVDDPGYYTLFAQLRTAGISVVGVPRGPGPLDTALVEALIQAHRPVAYFTNSVMHNPTGTSLSPGCAHRLLTIADRHQLLLVEDDVYGDLHPSQPLRLAALGDWKGIIYIGSFSKTLSSALRVGYLVAEPALASRLMDFKMLTAVSTSALPEAVILRLLESGQYRRFLSGLRARLDRTRARLLARLEAIGLRAPDDQGAGMYLWAELPDGMDAASVADEARERGVMLAPGNIFRPNGEASSHLRFNVACSDHPEVYRVLQEILQPRTR